MQCVCVYFRLCVIHILYGVWFSLCVRYVTSWPFALSILHSLSIRLHFIRLMLRNGRWDRKFNYVGCKQGFILIYPRKKKLVCITMKYNEKKETWSSSFTKTPKLKITAVLYRFYLFILAQKGISANTSTDEISINFDLTIPQQASSNL